MLDEKLCCSFHSFRDGNPSLEAHAKYSMRHMSLGSIDATLAALMPHVVSDDFSGSFPVRDAMLMAPY